MRRLEIFSLSFVVFAWTCFGLGVGFLLLGGVKTNEAERNLLAISMLCCHRKAEISCIVNAYFFWLLVDI